MTSHRASDLDAPTPRRRAAAPHAVAAIAALLLLSACGSTAGTVSLADGGGAETAAFPGIDRPHAASGALRARAGAMPVTGESARAHSAQVRRTSMQPSTLLDHAKQVSAQRRLAAH